MVSPSSVLILHGWQNHRPPGHWQNLLAGELQEAGVDVRYPQLPDPDGPDPTVWRERIAGEIGSLSGSQRVVVAHSLATWPVLTLLAQPAGLEVERILLAAPVAREVLAANPPIAAFDPLLDDSILRAAIGRRGAVDLVCSDDDPYFPGGAADWATGLGAAVHPLAGQGHLALGDGYGRWASVHDWVRGDRPIEPR
jgi:predicted alpha/beta hydrolase family esterase